MVEVHFCVGISALGNQQHGCFFKRYACDPLAFPMEVKFKNKNKTPNFIAEKNMQRHITRSLRTNMFGKTKRKSR